MKVEGLQAPGPLSFRERGMSLATAKMRDGQPRGEGACEGGRMNHECSSRRRWRQMLLLAALVPVRFLSRICVRSCRLARPAPEVELPCSSLRIPAGGASKTSTCSSHRILDTGAGYRQTPRAMDVRGNFKTWNPQGPPRPFSRSCSPTAAAAPRREFQ